jgi:tetratricopeptide (TPR) repeat protein
MRFISHFFYEDDVFKMKEIFYYAAIEEHVEQIRFTPIDLEVHASLANCYVSLARVYLNAKQIIDNKGKRKKRRYENYFEQKFQLSSLRAIEELNIINDYAPNDPWVHAQLAQCYHSLEMKKNEAQEYEKILEISGKDQEVKFRLAKIYFQMGKNAKALKIYEKLRLKRYKNADSLLNYYNSANISELFDEINI